MKAMRMNQYASNNTVMNAECTLEAPIQAHAGQMARTTLSGGQHGAANATHQLLTGIADGELVLSEDAVSGLLYMIEEEKMARDLYDLFADQTGSLVFDRISDSEQTHYDTLLLVAEKAGLDLSGLSSAAGVFTNPEIQSLYDSLYTQGAASLEAALQVGIIVENADIQDLTDFSADAAIGIVGTVYANLANGSAHHLAAFTQQLELVA